MIERSLNGMNPKQTDESVVPRRTDEAPTESSANRRYYETLQAVADCSIYRLEPAEEILFAKYYRPGDRILDLACGMGRTTLLLHESGYSVRGVDLSEVLISAARRRLPYLDLRVGSFTHIEEPDATFSHVLISSNAIDLALPVSQRMVALRECARVLRPGGTLIYSCHNLKALHWFSPRYWRRPLWKLQRTLKAFKPIALISEDDLNGLFAAPKTVISQTESVGFTFLEMIGSQMSAKPFRNDYRSRFIYYAFVRR